MARRIEHRSTSEWPASQVHAALIDIDYLRERLDQLEGGRNELVQHTADGDAVRFQIRQGVPTDSLPPIARTVAGAGDLVIDRSESWRCEQDGHYAGEIAAEVAGVPCTITGSMWLRDLTGGTGASELLVEGEVRVSVPFLGGKLEDLVAEQVQKLLAAEERFTTEWLARPRS
ncbi:MULTISPECIES: DUF2505 domain-containing protein [Saccharopolyspora]|uniref:DUF2505 domain-containing protein n=1 Tax=Saccharopolyspora gregorii TaxID=33914 RepID=A0ABP6S0Y0_9PSEU|nr:MULTISPECIES: DUF2505 domain-containing protein [Saccharopolyspora]MCA1186530.1 DUF2505 domain-containing protein [Saccharopolyspora sp. 6T]MCA1195629.1 DUF2505 domain-containing protein [Saccharopolyspora sp. 6V]MCA1227097.1 DUF2505 domain-containing protein [Saccharopolyspora sp. 6M]MCA1283301.1 DUF2505 domain-containing protein [Saccharopolyspora sp. 7B]